MGTSRNGETTISHQPGMPFGWVNRDCRSMPCFVCGVTGKPISPTNPGTLYWDAETGAMCVRSEEAEIAHGEPISSNGVGLNCIAVHILSQFLHENTAGRLGTAAHDETRRAANDLSTAV